MLQFSFVLSVPKRVVFTGSYVQEYLVVQLPPVVLSTL